MKITEFTTAALALAIAPVAFAQDTYPIVDFDGAFIGSPGSTIYDSFLSDATETADSIQIDTTGFGGLGLPIGPFDFNSDELQIRIRVRALPGNAAESFVVALTDSDGDDSAPGLGNEDWQWRVSTEGLSETEYTDYIFPLSAPTLGRIQNAGADNDGDEAVNFGAEFFLLQSEFDIRDRLAIEIDEIRLEQVCLTAPYTLADYGLGFARGGFSAMGQPGALTETDNSLQITVADFGGTGRAMPGEMNIPDPIRYQARITARLLPGNTAPNFQLVIADRDGDDSAPGLGTENYEYTFQTAQFQEGTYTEVAVPLTAPSRRGANFNSTNDGDEVLNPDIVEWFVQSPFGQTNPFNIEIKEIVIEPIGSSPSVTLVDFDINAAQTPGIFTYGSFSDGGLFPQAEWLQIDVADFGGLGINNGTVYDFEAASTSLEITGRALPGNTAQSFSLVLVDDDGDDTGPGTGDEEYQFDFSTADFGANPDGTVPAEPGFFSVQQPLTNPGPVFRQQGFNSLFDGDEAQNYGMFQWQFASTFGSTDRLLFDLDTVRLVSIIPAYDFNPDINQDGSRDFFDLLEFLETPIDVTNDGLQDNEDILFFITLLKCACPS